MSERAKLKVRSGSARASRLGARPARLKPTLLLGAKQLAWSLGVFDTGFCLVFDECSFLLSWILSGVRVFGYIPVSCL
jgi:hypothetical protein